MATIRPNDNAPQEDVNFILPSATFELSPSGTYETDDPSVIAEAGEHPWLAVEVPDVPEAAVATQSQAVAPEDDPLAGPNPDVNDPEKVAETEAAKAPEEQAPLAVEAGLDQTDPQTVGQGDHEVAVTLAADGDSTSTDEQPSRAQRRTAKKEN